ncbi:hypothetical protein CHGG_09376 [Chaetomium globosum CBS 148.51]|uniref:Response regulatory domain-containing protein n=1 Tax=Chaetomium globosum (strain ATCC 6205 / CBS 148.51 / DSM 1962 / NBRC 6347 / NRRL 1970) TaxID=306901 RepID=Q2GRM8_CHAGB|nr:uncharacterized protein CHGG_09376 [Chaetomium globosum CBS 148.51]EAQ85362.1 hypothetical protein CHGG_09376 [Chaetomium globosum CBS 148.51]
MGQLEMNQGQRAHASINGFTWRRSRSNAEEQNGAEPQPATTRSRRPRILAFLGLELLRHGQVAVMPVSNLRISSPSSIQEEAEQVESSPPPATAKSYREELDLRVHFGTRAGASVHGFPSTGGVYMLSCSVAELDFLGLDRFEIAQPSTDPDKEDAFCAKMRLLGPEWWPSLEAYSKAEWLDFTHQAYNRRRLVRFIGVSPEGGVWALVVEEEDCSNRQLGRINNAVNMEERCAQIKRFGGTFYADPSDCPLLDFKSPFPERATTHILLADGDDNNREITRSLMAEIGFTQVTTVGDGKEALAFLLAAAKNKAQEKPDIIFVDPDLPVIGGQECIQFLLYESGYSEFYSHLSVVAMPRPTTLGDNNLRAPTMTAVNAVLPRPIRKEQLEKILVHLALSGARRFLFSGPDTDDARRGAKIFEKRDVYMMSAS